MENLGNRKKKELLKDRELYLRCCLFWAKASKATFVELREPAGKLSQDFFEMVKSIDKDIANMII